MPRGGKRTPGPGKTMGPDPKPASEKHVKFGLSLPPDLFAWLDKHIKTHNLTRSGFIAELIRKELSNARNQIT